MADVQPFRALRYTGRLEAVLAPPYDVLSHGDVVDFQACSPYNVTHLTRPGSDYEGAARLLAAWDSAGVLAQDRELALWIHETDFQGRRRLDLMAALRLQPYTDGAVVPHERTHQGPKADRLALLRATAASLEPIWFLAEGLRPLLEGAPAGEVIAFEYEGEPHRLVRITDAAWSASVIAELVGRPVLIADGHHRYETGLAHAQELGGGSRASSRFTLALLTDLQDPGLVVLPTHRVMKSGVAVTGGEPAGSLEEALTAIRGRVAAAYYRGGAYQVLPLEGEVPLVELHRQLIDNLLGRRSAETELLYTRDPGEAVAWVDEGRGVAAFLLDTPDLSVVLRLARQGATMPQKATYFFPKPPVGMAFLRLDPGRNL